MEYYYKQIDENGKIKMLLTCSMLLDSSDTQIQISQEEYNFLLSQFEQEESNDSEINYNLA